MKNTSKDYVYKKANMVFNCTVDFKKTKKFTVEC